MLRIRVLPQQSPMQHRDLNHSNGRAMLLTPDKSFGFVWSLKPDSPASPKPQDTEEKGTLMSEAHKAFISDAYNTLKPKMPFLDTSKSPEP